MDETECTASNFMPKDPIEIICILERNEKCHLYKLYERGSILLSSLNFLLRMENRRH